ncbi:tyrosine-type recombinase/integrase [Actinospica robiniae]|uniref:tyrosine-type recombinase/integrase n=1 Tax=Actinospica robiniae TaxID=304901 RepID=UPI000423050C|nr:site-specific integrase [Actinospica robiniae]
MGFISKTPAGGFRANWRDPAGRQRAKTFRTKREASAHLAEMETATTRGAYVDPNGAKTKFGAYASTWLEHRATEKTSHARDLSYMRTHVMPRWNDVPMGKVTYSMVQAWVVELSKALAPASVVKCHQLTSAVFTAAVRDRLISSNPCEGVKLPSVRRSIDAYQIIPMPVVREKLLPALPSQYQALVAVGAGAGLRWGECLGLCLDSIDLSNRTLTVRRTVVEVSGTVSMKPYPKSRAGFRTVPLPGWLALVLKVHMDEFAPGPSGELFVSASLGPLYRGTFRLCVWRPALVRAGLLGSIAKQDDGRFLASWTDAAGEPCRSYTKTEDAAVVDISRGGGKSLRFHDLRHSYATWLISTGVPVNEVARVLGHEQVTTTLNRYTHVLPDVEARNQRIRDALADFPLTPPE